MIGDIENLVCGGETDEAPSCFHRPFLVQCGSRPCLAYCHADGKWRHFESGAELPDFVRVIDED